MTSSVAAFETGKINVYDKIVIENMKKEKISKSKNILH